MNSWTDRAVDAEFVLRLRKKKGSPSPSITITRRGKFAASCAVTAITESSDGTDPQIYFDGWLTT
jgi:hypothetical protein